MPFAETHVMEERKRFIEEAHRSVRSFAAVCDRYGISRKTGYKWMDRWRQAGPSGLEDRSSRPRRCPWVTPAEIVEAILEVRRKFEDFGPKKIRWYLERSRPELALPSRQTMHNILVRHDLLRSVSLPSHPDLLAEKLQTRSILTLHLVSFQGVRSIHRFFHRRSTAFPYAPGYVDTAVISFGKTVCRQIAEIRASYLRRAGLAGRSATSLRRRQQHICTWRRLTHAVQLESPPPAARRL